MQIHVREVLDKYLTQFGINVEFDKLDDAEKMILTKLKMLCYQTTMECMDKYNNEVISFLEEQQIEGKDSFRYTTVIATMNLMKNFAVFQYRKYISLIKFLKKVKRSKDQETSVKDVWELVDLTVKCVACFGCRCAQITLNCFYVLDSTSQQYQAGPVSSFTEALSRWISRWNQSNFYKKYDYRNNMNKIYVDFKEDLSELQHFALDNLYKLFSKPEYVYRGRTISRSVYLEVLKAYCSSVQSNIMTSFACHAQYKARLGDNPEISGEILKNYFEEFKTEMVNFSLLLSQEGIQLECIQRSLTRLCKFQKIDD